MSALVNRRRALAVGIGAALVLGAGEDRAAATPAPSVDPDAALVLLAGRVEALAGRLWRADDRFADLECRLSRLPRHPVPPVPPTDIVTARGDTATEWVLTMRQPLAPDPAMQAWRAAKAAAERADESAAAALRRRLGMAEVERRRARMRARLARWANRLAETEAETPRGLSAKAGAFLAIGGDRPAGLWHALHDHQDLVMSVLRRVAGERGAVHA